MTTLNADDLRREFDQSFVEQRQTTAAAIEDFLTFEIDADLYAVRLADVASLHHGQKIVPFPGASVPGLLGIAGFRGIVVPIYDLHQMLGYAPAGEYEWLLLAKTSGQAVGFAFYHFVSHRRVHREAILPPDQKRGASPTVSGGILIEGQFHSLLNTQAILQTVTWAKRN